MELKGKTKEKKKDWYWNKNMKQNINKSTKKKMIYIYMKRIIYLVKKERKLHNGYIDKRLGRKKNNWTLMEN